MRNLGLLATVPLRARGRIRWGARILGLSVALFAATMGIGSALTEPEEPLTATGVGVAIFVVWIIACMLGAWRWEKLGGTLGIATGVAFGLFVYFTAGRNEVPASLSLGLPIVAISIGFLLAGRRTAEGREAG